MKDTKIMKKNTKYLLSMLFIFLFGMCLLICFLFAPLDRFKAFRGHGNLTQAEALFSKIYGSCMLMTIVICSAFKIDELYARVRLNKIGPKRKKTKKKIEAFAYAMFIFMIASFITFKLLQLVWPYSIKDITIGSLVTNLASILSLVIGILIAIRSFRSSLHAKTD